MCKETGRNDQFEGKAKMVLLSLILLPRREKENCDLGAASVMYCNCNCGKVCQAAVPTSSVKRGRIFCRKQGEGRDGSTTPRRDDETKESLRGEGEGTCCFRHHSVFYPRFS